MSYSIRNRLPSPLEQQYAELKKQFVAEHNNNSALQNNPNEQNNFGVIDEVTLSSSQVGNKENVKRKPSEPVTADEAKALREQVSIYA